jgi:hypothetical protein
VIEPRSGCIGQVDGEELNDKQVAICPACPACEVVVLYPDTGISFTVILDDIVGHSKTLGEAHVAHVTPKHLGPRPLRNKATSFLVVAPTAVLDARVVLDACPIIFPVSLTAGHRLEGFARMAWSET